MKQRPLEENEQLHMECSINKIYPQPPLSFFNITLPKQNRTFITNKMKNLSFGGYAMTVQGTITASIDLDGETAICQVTTATGKHFKKENDIHVHGRSDQNLSLNN